MKTMMLLLATVCAVAFGAAAGGAEGRNASPQGPRGAVAPRSSGYALLATPAESLMWRAKAAQMQAQIERDPVRSAYWLGQRDAYLSAAEMLVGVEPSQASAQDPRSPVGLHSSTSALPGTSHGRCL
jgi:hypothetical protein